jgi:protein phosphatase
MTDRPKDDTQSFHDRQSDSETETGPHGRRRGSVRVEAAGLSHRGAVRDHNEDHFLVARVERSLETLSTSLPSGEVPDRFGDHGCLMMVADGMGGAAGGEVASRTAISALVNIVLDVPDWIMRMDDEAEMELSRRAIQYCRQVNSALVARAQARPELSGMGTTMTVAYNVGEDLSLAHVGDSRAYLLRGDKLRQLTRDHTHVQRLIDAGTITREQGEKHRLRHVLTNVMGGTDESVHVDLRRLKLVEGDVLLLCTDGLSEVLGDDRIGEVLGSAETPESACRKLVDLALEGGGPDNVTVVAARWTAEEPETD